ncbi:MAG: hypothetical protein J0L62_11225 [Bacteroidetes bacterium]|nr:hypothetical protein [Bacteroidota bacterium]
MALKISQDYLEKLRDQSFRRTKALSIKTEQDAVDFINSVGFCFAFKSELSELPSIWNAVKGERRPEIPTSINQDPDVTFTWSLKDKLPQNKKSFYGKFLKKQPTFISVEYVPYFFVLNANVGSADSSWENFVHKHISEAEKRVLDTILEEHPITTIELRRKMESTGKYIRPVFDKSLQELERKMYIMEVGRQEHPYTPIWDMVVSHFAGLNDKINPLTEDLARERILEKYFQVQVISNEKRIQALFNWQPKDIDNALENLRAQGHLVPISLVASRGRWLAHHTVQDLLK